MSSNATLLSRVGKRKKKSKLSLKRIRVKHPRIFVFVMIFFALVIAWPLASWLSWSLTPAREKYTFATSFSVSQAELFKTDWKANYLALLDDMQIRQFRLMSYWNRYEPVRGEIDLSELDWQMDEAARRGAKVSLVVGLRQPRWPECHEPKWSTALPVNEWKQALYAYMEVVVKRYRNHPALESLQLENESQAWYFGDCRQQPDPVRVREEFDLVRRWTDKPVWMSLSDQYGMPWGYPGADAYGYSLYTKVYNNLIPGTYVNPSPPLWFHTGRGAIISAIYGKPLFLHELQLEPWGPKNIVDLTRQEQDMTMSPDKIRYNLEFGRKLGVDQIYTWGSEWWYWRKINGDTRPWDTVKQAVAASKL